jgi:hypothetical protein
MLAIEQSDPAKIVQDQAGWFTNIAEGINPRAVGKWRLEMSEREQCVFASVAGRELARLGYEPGSPRVIQPGEHLGYLLHDTTVRGVNVVRLRIVQERGRELRYVLLRKLRPR